MKNKILPLLLLLGSTYAAAQTVIENPSFETRQGSAHTISKIEQGGRSISITSY